MKSLLNIHWTLLALLASALLLKSNNTQYLDLKKGTSLLTFSVLPKQAGAEGHILFYISKREKIAADFLCSGREDEAVLISPSPGHLHGPSMKKLEREPDPDPEETEMELPWDL